MKIYTPEGRSQGRCGGQAAFTLIEVAFAAAIAALVLAGMFGGYNMAGRRAQFAACNLAANAAAMCQLERVITADWIPSATNQTLLNQSTTVTGNLCLPSANGNVINCTNNISVTENSSGPAPYAMVTVQCIWTFPNYGGIYTNTIAVLRAPNL